MQDVCRIVPASALPKVLICTRQTMRHWGRLQWGDRRGGVVLFCYGEQHASTELVIFVMRRAGDRVLLGWLGRAGAGDSFYYSSSPPPAPALLLSTPCTPTVTWSLVTWSLITLDTVTADANISLSPSFHFQSGLKRQCRCIEMLNVNVHLKALIERMERQLFR